MKEGVLTNTRGKVKKKESTIGKRQNIGTAEVKHGYRYILIKRETSG
jgi:hypothetical protein